MKVEELMTDHVEMVSSDKSLRVASRKMLNLNIGSLPVIDSEKLVGFITDRDITCFAVAIGRDPNSTPIEKVMNKDLATCYNNDDISDAARLMEARHIRRLTVLDHHNRVIGLLSIDDLARGSHELAGAVLESAGTLH